MVNLVHRIIRYFAVASLSWISFDLKLTFVSLNMPKMTVKLELY
ncbi:hypothetical protein [Arsenophonus endosymbiont of Aleurodicus dispersus]|nr:hypothetical protein [Arsenophonus endosymbiont of Aleurodicus dispersus]